MTRRSNPFEDIERLFEQMSSQFDEMGGLDTAALGARTFDVDVAEYDDEITVVADLPGFESDDIDVAVSGRTLTISGDRESSIETDGEYVRHERRSESVRRSISLPADVAEEEASASYNNGVLTVSLPKLHADDESHDIDVE